MADRSKQQRSGRHSRWIDRLPTWTRWSESDSADSHLRCAAARLSGEPPPSPLLSSPLLVQVSICSHRFRRCWLCRFAGRLARSIEPALAFLSLSLRLQQHTRKHRAKHHPAREKSERARGIEEARRGNKGGERDRLRGRKRENRQREEEGQQGGRRASERMCRRRIARFTFLS